MSASINEIGAVNTRRPAAARAHRVLVDIFLAGLAAQFFLAGLGVFGADRHGNHAFAAAASFAAHRTVGNALILLSVVIAVAALAGRRMIRQSLALAVLTFLQSVWTKVGSSAPAIGSLHVLGAFAITLLAFVMHRATHDRRPSSDIDYGAHRAPDVPARPTADPRSTRPRSAKRSDPTR